MRSKNIDFKKIHLSMPDFIDNEAYEYLLEVLGVERLESDLNEITLTVTKIEIK